MIGYVRIVRVRTYIDANLIDRIAIQRDRTFLNAISGGIVAESIMAKDSLAGIGAFADTLLILIRGPGGVGTDRHAGVVEGLPEQVLHPRALQHTLERSQAEEGVETQQILHQVGQLLALHALSNHLGLARQEWLIVVLD